MNEELCHRNMAFTLYQADEMPQMKIGETKVEKLGGGVYRVWRGLANPKLAPTILAKAAENNVVRPTCSRWTEKGSRCCRPQLGAEQATRAGPGRGSER
jgi:hypothetical protein